MSKTPRILVVDDDRTIREALVSTLEEAGYDAVSAEGISCARARLTVDCFDTVLLDIRLKDGDGISLLEEIREKYPQLPVIMATAFGDSEHTIRAMKLGAFEYVTKPFDLDVLLSVLARSVAIPVVAAAVGSASASDFVGASPAMLEVWKSIGRASASLAPVLITGESGVGKELVAQAIHKHSGCSDGPFVAVNIAALPASLVESELFGHEKGAFTGAASRREGRFELASGGTLFLDEIGDLELPLQTKLLRVLENGSFERVGGTSSLKSSARIVCATSRPVAPGSQGCVLREDLYYRIGVIRLEVSPLRNRTQDIPLLVDAFLRRQPLRRAISEDAMKRLVAYSWPGNVRQLLHTIENACVMSGADVLDAADFDLPSIGNVTPQPVVSDLDDSRLDLRMNLERLERSLIERALVVSKGNRAQASRLLGIRRALLYARMKHLGMSNEGEGEGEGE